MPGPGPDQPGQALPGGTPHAVRGVPGHRTVTNPAQSSSEQFTWPTSVVCDSAVDGNIEIPSGGTPQDVHVFNLAVLVEKVDILGWFYMVVCMGHHTNYSWVKTFGTVFRAR